MTPLRLRIAEERKAKGLTIDELAANAGVSRSTIIRLENQHTVQVHFDVLEKLADALGVAPSGLRLLRGATSREKLVQLPAD